MNAVFRGDVTIAGAFLGAGFGFVWADEHVVFSPKGSAIKRAERVLLGLAVMALIYILPKFVAPAEGEALYNLVRFLRYALVGGWIALGAPWLFLRLKLATTES